MDWNVLGDFEKILLRPLGIISSLLNIENVNKMSLYYSHWLIHIHFTPEWSNWEFNVFIRFSMFILCYSGSYWKDYNKLSIIFWRILGKKFKPHEDCLLSMWRSYRGLVLRGLSKWALEHLLLCQGFTFCFIPSSSLYFSLWTCHALDTSSNYWNLED